LTKLHPCQLRCGTLCRRGVCDDCRATVGAEAVGFALPKDMAMLRLRDAAILLRAARAARNTETVVKLMDQAATMMDHARESILNMGRTTWERV
jgi:hypothetical protein